MLGDCNRSVEWHDNMNRKGDQGRICRSAALAGAAKNREITMNGYAVHMECPSLGTSGPELNLMLFHLHSNLHTDIVQL